MRRRGMPNSTPTTVAQTPPSSSATISGMPSMRTMEVVGRVGADRHEGAGAERDLAAVADQDVQPERGERQDQERDQDGAQQVFGGDQRHGDEGQREQHGDRDPVLQDREDLLVGAVAGLELAVFAVEHGVVRRGR